MPAVTKAIVACAQGAIAMINPLNSPLWRGALHSMANGTAAEYSPAMNMPPTKRSATNSAKVAPPSTRCVGSAAINSVQAAVPAMATAVVRVRPARSAIRPKTVAPTGRPSSIAITTMAVPEDAALGPARVFMAGARASAGRKMLTWST